MSAGDARKCIATGGVVVDPAKDKAAQARNDGFAAGRDAAVERVEAMVRARSVLGQDPVTNALKNLAAILRARVDPEEAPRG